MEQMNALVAMHPTHAHLYVARGGMEQQRKLYEQALVDYNHAIELEPKNPEHYLTRGSFYLSIKKRRLARADFHEALRLGADAEEVASLMKELRR